MQGRNFMQLTSLIGKLVLSPAGEKIGYVIAALPSRDLKKVSCLLCADNDEEEFYLPVKNILSYGDALIANRSRTSIPTGISCPIGNAVYSHTGGFLGTLGELLLGDGGAPLFIVHHEGSKLTFPYSRVSLGDAVIVYPEGCKKPAPAKITPPKKTKPKSQPEKSAKSKTMPEAEPVQPVPDPQSSVRIAASPTDALNRVNLLGRKLKKSVYDENGCPIAVAGERITETIVSLARRSNRLLQLTVNTLTNVI